MKQTIYIGRTSIVINDHGTMIEFADGVKVAGEPHDTDSYRATAEKYGYGYDTLKLCIDHEIMHVALAYWLGIDSPTMEAVRSDNFEQNVRLRELEETAVLAIQQFARASGLDITRLFSHPADI